MRFALMLAVAMAWVGQASAQHTPSAMMDLFRELCLNQGPYVDGANVLRARDARLLQADEMDGLQEEPLLNGNWMLSGYSVVADGGSRVILGTANWWPSLEKSKIACALRWRASPDFSPLAALEAAFDERGVATSDGHAWKLSGRWKRVVLKQNVKPEGVTYSLIAFDK